MRIPSERMESPSASPVPAARAFDEELAELEATLEAARLRSEARRAEAAIRRRSRRRSSILVTLVGVAWIALAGAVVALAPDLDDPRSRQFALEQASTDLDPAPVPSAAEPDERANDGPAAPKSSELRPAASPVDVGASDGPALSVLLADAERFAAGREGEIGFAVIDGGSGVRGRSERTQFPSASVVKSMLLAAELRRLDAEGLPLDSATEALLTSMITISDNDAATAVYSRVGDAGLNAIAQRTGMKDFEVAISWGYAQITAGDMARLFAQLDRILPDRFEKFGKGLLGSITPEQSWGIPAVAKDWSVRFKGGWVLTDSGQLVSQAAELRRGERALSMAILTDGQPSMAYGIETVEGITARLLGRG